MQGSESITARQFFVMVVSMIMGVGVLTLPRGVAMLPKKSSKVFVLGTRVSYIGTVLAGAIPIFLLLIVRLRRLGTYAKK